MDTRGGGDGDASILVESPDDRLGARNKQPPKTEKEGLSLYADIPLTPSNIR